MKYTEKEIKQIHAHIEKITEFLLNITRDLGNHFDLTFDREQRYSLSFYNYWNDPSISGWIGSNFCIAFNHSTKPTEHTIFNTDEITLDFCVCILQKWNHIKTTLQTEIQRQNDIREIITNFEI